MNLSKKLPLFPRATAIWLIDNTALTFRQIADFCGIHELEVKRMADEATENTLKPYNPVVAGELTKEEIERCTKNTEEKLVLSSRFEIGLPKKKARVSKYTPIAHRHDKPNAILWLLKYCPDIQDTEIIKLIGTTKHTILSIKERTHWNINSLKPRDPVLLGLCSQIELDNILDKYSEKSDKKNV